MPSRTITLTTCLLWTLWGCNGGNNDQEGDDTGPGTESPTDTGSPEDTGDSEIPEDTGDSEIPEDTAVQPDLPNWTFLVFMNGDNNLEAWVINDLNELEEGGGSTDDLNVLVLADRAEDYYTGDGDWTDSRIYYIVGDDDPDTIASPVVEEWGEVDMGDPQTLSDFLLWANENYPAKHMALSMWDHGDGWSMQAVPPPYISEDDESGSWMSIAEGDLSAGLEELVALRGPLDVIGFDACNMGSWEVAHTLKDQVLYMTAAEVSVGMEGFMYDMALDMLHDNSEATDAELALELAESSVLYGGEGNQAATDLLSMAPLTEALDALAGLVLDNPDLEGEFIRARDNASGMDPMWENWYMDIKDLAVQLSESTEPELVDAGLEVLDGIELAVEGVWNHETLDYAGGLTIFTDFEALGGYYMQLYCYGEGATWSQETRWDDLMLELRGY